MNDGTRLEKATKSVSQIKRVKIISEYNQTYHTHTMNNDPLIRDFVTLNKAVIKLSTKVFISLTL